MDTHQCQITAEDKFESSILLAKWKSALPTMLAYHAYRYRSKISSHVTSPLRWRQNTTQSSKFSNEIAATTTAHDNVCLVIRGNYEQDISQLVHGS